MQVYFVHRKSRFYAGVAGFILSAIVVALVYVPPHAEGRVVYASIFDDAELFLVANQYSGSGDWLDQSGNGHNAQFGSTAGADTNDPLFLDYTGTQYLHLPGIGGNYASTPDTAPLDITGDLSLQAFIALDDWTPTAENRVIAKWQGTERSYLLSIFTDGKVRFGYSTTGADQVIVDSTVAVAFADGTTGGIRADFDVDAGASDNEVTFFTAVGLGGPWVQLGSIQNNAGTVTMHSGTAILEVGSGDGGTFGLLGGKVYEAQILDGIGGTLEFDADFTDTSAVTEPFATFTEASSNAATVTINRSSTGRKSTVVDQDMFLLGTDDYFEVADDAGLDFTDQDLTVMAAMRSYDVTPAAVQVLVAKKDGGGVTAGYRLVLLTNASIEGGFGDGTFQSNDTESSVTDGTAAVVAAQRKASEDVVEAFIDGVSGGGTTENTNSTFANAFPLRVGANSNATTEFWDGEIHAVALWRRALSDAEIASIDISQLTRGGSPPRNLASIDLIVHTSPDTNVGILLNGGNVADGDTGRSGIFRKTLFASQGNAEFNITATDKLGLSSEQSISSFVRWGSRINMPAIVMPPTISYEVNEDGIRLYGNAYPESIVTLIKNDARSAFTIVQANKDGSWEHVFDTSEIDMTKDSIQANVQVRGIITSPLSKLIVFDGENEGDTEDHQLTLREIEAKLEEIALKVEKLTEQVKELTKLVLGT